MGAVGGAEGVVDVDLSQGSELFGETGVVLLLLGEEADVLKQHDITVGHRAHLGLSIGADAAVGLGDGLAQQLAQAGRHRREAHVLFHFTFGATEVGRKDHLGALAGQIIDGGQRRADAGVIGDGAGIVEGNIEIHPHQNALTAQRVGGEGGQGALRHGAGGDGARRG